MFYSIYQKLKDYLEKHWQKLKLRKDSLRRVLSSEKFLANLAALPLYLPWLIALSLEPDNPRVRRISLLSGISTLFFLIMVLLSWLFSGIESISYGIHLLGVILYVISSLFLLYTYNTGKKIGSSIVDGLVKKIEGFL